MLSDDPAEPVEAGDAVPLGVLGGEATRILVGLPSLSRLGRLVPRLKAVTSVPPLVERLSGFAPRLPTRITMLVMAEISCPCRRDHPVDSPRKARRSGSRAPQADTPRGTPKQGRRGQPEGQHGPQRRGLRGEAAEPGGLTKEMG